MRDPVQRRRLKVAASALLLATMILGAVIVDSVGAAVFFYVNSERLQAAADQAAVAGASFLPSNPDKAVSVARIYAGMNGVRGHEIVFTAVSGNQHRITIELQRPLPFYLTGIIVGITSRQILATGTAASVAPPVRAIARGISA